MAEALIINGVTIDRIATPVTIVRCSPWVKDGYPTLTIARRGIKLAAGADPWDAKTVTYQLPNGTLIFDGDSQDHLDHNDEHLGWVREWTCFGRKKRADYIPVTDEVTGSDTARFNVAGDDPSAIPARQGRNVGQIATEILTMLTNATALNAAGLGAYTSLSPPTLPAATVADLAALTVILPYEAIVAGERILQSLEGMIQSGHPNHWIHVELNGTIRVLDPRTYSTTVTLTLGSADRVGMPQLRRDWCNSYSRVIVRGGPRVMAVTEQVAPWPGSSNTDGGMVKDYAHDGLSIAQAEAAWRASDFTQPGAAWGQALAHGSISGGAVTPHIDDGGYGYTSAPPVVIAGDGSGASATAVLTGSVVTSFTSVSGGSGYTHATVVIGGPGSAARDAGTCTCPSTTTVTVTSQDPTVHWGLDYWDQTTSGADGQITLYADVITGVTQHFQARIIANTAMTPGGTSTLTLDQSLPALTYNAYQITGLGVGASLVGRKYKLSNTHQASAILNYFPYQVPYWNADGSAAAMTSTPIGTVLKSADGSGNAPFIAVSVGITVDPTSGHVYFDKPVQLTFSPNQKDPVWPDNVQAFLPIQSGTLAAVYPLDTGGTPTGYPNGTPNYAGTAFSVEGISRTKYISVNDWRDYGNQTNMNLYALEMHGALSPTVVEGSIPYYGLLTTALTPGFLLDIAADVYTTGWESAALPAVAVELIFNETQGANIYETVVHFSTRRQPYSAAVFQRPSQTGLSVVGGFEGSLSLTSGGMASAIGAQQANLSEQFTETRSQISSGMAAQDAARGPMSADLANAANFGSNALDASAMASMNLPQTPGDMGIATNPDAFLPSMEDFGALGIDMSPPAAAAPTHFNPPAPDAGMAPKPPPLPKDMGAGG